MSQVSVIDRSSPVPLWAQIRQDLRERALSGDIAGRFPTETELVRYYDVSRHTIREAIAHLESDGLLVRERGRAVALARPQIEQPLNTFYSLARSLRSQGLDERSDVLRKEVTQDLKASEVLQLAQDDTVVYVERLRFAGDEPLALDRSWLPEGLAAPLLSADLSTGSLYDTLAILCDLRVSGGWERIRPLNPSSEERELLQLPRKEAVFAIERVVMMSGRPLEWRLSKVRGDRYSFVANWE